MNITLSADDAVVEKARLVAQRQGMSLNELVRGYLRALAGETSGAASAQELFQLMDEQGGRSGGARMHRDAIYQERLRSPNEKLPSWHAWSW